VMFPWLAKHKLAALAVVAAVAILGAGTLAAQAPTVFRSNVNLVHVIASVKNSKGELVGALQKSDFQVFDNGVPQEVAVFERQTSQPVSVALLIDASGSTAKDLKYEIDSATKFLHALLSEGNPDDAVALFSFDDQVREMRHFTHNYASLDAALRLVHGSGGTSLYDAIYLASQELESREGRKILVIISDGGNTTSTIDSHKALRQAQMSDAVIYPVVVVPITNEAGRNTGGEHALVFMAEGTGGRTFFPTFGKELDKAFADIVTELRTQYYLGYYPRGVPLTKEPFHKLEVHLNLPDSASSDLRVSARNGYYGEAEGAGGSPDAHIAVTPAAVTPAGRKKK
jgi:Ca-activated chloride channel family protein